MAELSTPTSTRTRRVWRWLGFAAAVCILLAVIGLVVLQTSPVKNYARARITQALADNNIDFSAQGLDYNPLDLSAELRNVRVKSPVLPDAPPFIKIERARVDLSPWQLLRGRYVVQHADADGVRVHYFVDEQGVDNLPRPPRDPDQPSKPIDYLIEDLRVSDASVRYENRAQEIDINLPRATLTMEGDALTDRHDVTIEAPDGSAEIGDRTVHLDQLTAALDLGRDDVRIERAELVADGASLNVSGSIGPFDDPIADIAYQASIDAARAADVANLNEPVAGQISLEGSAKGQINALIVDVAINGHDVRFRELRGINLDAAGSYGVGSDVVQLSHVHVTGPIGTIKAAGQIALKDTAESRLNGSVDALEAEPLMRSLDVPYRLASRVDGRINASWPGLHVAQATGKAQLALTPTATRASDFTLPLGGRIDVSGTGQQLNASLRGVRTAGAEVDGRVIVSDGERLDGSLQLRSANVEQAITSAEHVLGRESLVPMRVAGGLTAKATLRGTTQAPIVNATLTAPSLAIGDAHDVRVAGDITYRSDRLTIGRLEMAWRDAHATARGTIGLTGNTPMDLTARADALQVSQLLRAFEHGDIPAWGTLSAQAQVNGTARNPVATIQLQGSNLMAYHEVLGSLDAGARYAANELTVTNLVLDKPQPGGDGRISGTGSYQPSTGQFTLDLSSSHLQLQSLQLPGGPNVTGGVRLQAKASGTLDQPSGSIDIAATDLTVGEYLVGDLTADTRLADGTAMTTARAPRFGIDARSSIGLEAPYPATITAQADDLNLAALPLQLQTPLEGTLSARVEGEGPLSEPRSGRATATIQSFAGSFRQQPFQLEQPAQLRYDDERLAIDRLQLRAQDSHLSISGNLPLEDRAAAGTINIEGSANLATLAQYLPVGYELAADGRLTINGTVEGTLQAIDPSLRINVEDALVLSPAIEPGISNLDAALVVDAGSAAVEQLTANWGSAQINMSGRVPLDVLPNLPVEVPRPGGRAALEAHVSHLDPSAIPGAPEGLNGQIAFDVKVSSAMPDLGDAEGRIAFSHLQLGFNGLSLEQKAPSTIVLNDGVARVEQLALGGSVGTVTAAGTVGLAGDRPINVDVDGNLNIAAISILTDAVRAEGPSTLDIEARGTVADPILSGTISLTDGSVVIDDPRIAAEALNVRLTLDQNRINIATLNADINGGTLTGSGTVAVRGGTLEDVDVNVALRAFAFDAPLDLRSLSNTDLRIRSDERDIVVGGQVTIEEGGLTGNINFDTGLLASITARRELELTPQRNPLLERVTFNLDVNTASPILVDNNLAKAEVSVDVRVVGTPYEPGLLGRLTVAEGGLITLNERTYDVERGRIAFINDRRIVPSFDLRLTTDADRYDITLAVSGEPGNTRTSLTSDPSLPEPDIMSLLVTGRTLEEMRGQEYEVAREQVLSYLTGRVGSTLGRELEQATGLTEVRIEPQLIANEADPGARLTVGQDLSRDLSLAYSVDLANSNDQIWLATYDVTRRFRTRAVRQSDNTYRFDFSHDIRKGGRPAPRRVPRVRPHVRSISVPQDAPIPAAELRDLLGVEQGDAFDYFAARNGTEDIEARLREAGWAQSKVRLHRADENGGVSLDLDITAGPQVEFVYTGMPVPRDVREDVRLQWQRGVFDAQRTDDAAEVIRTWLMDDNYLQAEVTAQVDDPAPDRRVVSFAIEPGPRAQRVLLTFDGASAIPSDELNEVIGEQDLERELFTDPTVATELLERLYREQGYLGVDISKPRYEFDGPVARVVLPISEGPQFAVSDVAVRGNRAIPASALLVDLPVVEGDPFRPTAVENAMQRIRDLYWARGYNEVRVNYDLTIDRIGGRAGVAFTIAEGRQSIVSEIRVAGNDQTSDHLLREQIVLEPSQPLSLQELSKSRENLYDTGAFSVVDLSRDTVVDADQSTVGAITGLEPTQKPVVVEVAVREVQPYQLRYGASYDTEGKLGGVLDASLHNLFGKARVVGLAARYDGQVHEGRVYFSQPTLHYWPVQTTASVYYRDERNPATSISDAFNVDRRGASIQQERRLRDSYVWTYGYRFERARTFAPLAGAVPEAFIQVSPLTSAIVRDVRDEVLDATRGSFSSHALSFSPSWLGSDDTYLKYVGQYFKYFPLQSPRRKRFSNEIIRPRFVFATAARIGLSRGMGTFVPTSERFFAGGSTSLRGFQQNAVGPISASGIPMGGDAMLVLNNELRFPLISIVDGVTFADIGNVWQKTSDFSFTDLRKTAGVGLRLRTKWVLVRTDYGFILDRRAGERKGRFYFSIGQAF